MLLDNWWNLNTGTAEPLTEKSLTQLFDNMKKESVHISNPYNCLVSTTVYAKMRSGEFKHCIACGSESKVHFND